MRLRRRKNEGESHKALAEAQHHVELAKSRNPEVYQVAGKLRRMREANHFAEQIYTIMSGNPESRGS
jgi:hypothetical protein